MTWGEKKVFVKNNVNISSKARIRQRGESNNTSRRQYSVQYFLLINNEKHRVCKKMFGNTLGISQRTVLSWIMKGNDEDRRVINEVLNPKISDERPTIKSDLKGNIRIFFETLAKMESHYCRASSSKLYLEPNWQSKAELYNEYKNIWCKEKGIQHAAMTTFSRIFDELNLSLFKPKKDECDICTSYKMKNITEEEYLDHQKRKQNSRNEKENDKKNSKFVYTMDLQSVLLCPKSNVSCLYYKTKLIVHNFTIYDLKTNDGYCFLWHEGEGGLNANEFASMISYFILKHVVPKMDENHREIILYSDGCTYQNRNAVLSNALMNVSINKKLIITQKFLEKGHTQMEVDSMHSVIERKLKNRMIYVPANYIDICKEARTSPRPYEVEYLNYSFFKNFDNIKFVKSIRPGKKVGDPTVTQLRGLRYVSEGQVFFKIDFESEWEILPQRLDSQNKPVDFNSLPNLYNEQLKIKKEKFEHLQSLKYIMPADYHLFYDNLPHS